jgi:hypothetical protein
MPANAIRNGEHPPVRPSLLGSRRGNMANMVFIVVANSPNIGSFRELYFQHMRCAQSSG